VQVAVLPVSDKVAAYAANVATELKAAGFRVYLDDRNEKLGAKIRDSEMQKFPYMAVVGGKEAEAGAVSVRHHGKGDLGVRPLDAFIKDLQAEVERRAAMEAKSA
jgi:threonyl-tRNA synthetase